MPLAGAGFLDSMEDLALGEMFEERLREHEADPVTFSHEEVFGRADAETDRE